MPTLASHPAIIADPILRALLDDARLDLGRLPDCEWVTRWAQVALDAIGDLLDERLELSGRMQRDRTEYTRRMVAQCGGNRAEAARLMGIGRRTVDRRMRLGEGAR